MHEIWNPPIACSDLIDVEINGTIIPKGLVIWIHKEAHKLRLRDRKFLRFPRVITHLDFLIDEILWGTIVSRKRAGNRHPAGIILIIDVVREIADIDGVGILRRFHIHSIDCLDRSFAHRPVGSYLRADRSADKPDREGGKGKKGTEDDQIVMGYEFHCRRHTQHLNPRLPVHLQIEAFGQQALSISRIWSLVAGSGARASISKRRSPTHADTRNSMPL
jgi:hypothetical protein